MIGIIYLDFSVEKDLEVIFKFSRKECYDRLVTFVSGIGGGDVLYMLDMCFFFWVIISFF